MTWWRFLDYLNARGDNEIRNWVCSLPPHAQAKIDYLLIVLSAWKIWPPQYVSALKGYKDIREFRIVAFGVQYRPIGCYGPGEREYTLLVGAIEKGGKLPTGTCEIAVERRKIILQDRKRVRDHEFS